MIKSSTDLALKAFETRPSRAEPLADLARHYRERGMNETAQMFARRGMEISASDDMLFVETGAQEECRNTFAICAFYARDAETKALGARICDQLALDRSASPQARDTARQNLYWYLQPISELLPSWSARRLQFTPPDGYRQMAPSVTRHGKRLMAAQRCINYWIDEGGYNTPGSTPENRCPVPVHTRTLLVEFDADTLAETVLGEIKLPVDFPPALPDAWVQGFEDLRLFSWRGELWGISTVREQAADGAAEQWLARIGPDLHMCEARPIFPQGIPRRHEKNWMPLVDGDDLRFIYLSDPTTILDRDGSVVGQRTPQIAADHFRGGSQAIPFDGGWLAVIHFVVWLDGWPKYRHRFAWYDADYRLQHTSPGWVFSNKHPELGLLAGYEYCTGLCWHPDERRLVLGYQIHEREAWLASVEADDVRALLGFSPAAPPVSIGYVPTMVRDRRILGRRFDFWLADPVGAVWYGKEDQTEPDKAWCLERIKPGMTVYDCGAHHGQMTVLFSKAVGLGGRVCAWEALPENAVIIERNLLLNHCLNALVYPYAVGAKQYYQRFHRNGGNAVPGDEITVYTVALDDFPSRYQPVDFIKIDVEGAELAVLTGALTTLQQSRPIIDLELHLSMFDDRVSETQEIVTILRSIGYSFEYPDLSRNNTHIYCEP